MNQVLSNSLSGFTIVLLIAILIVTIVNLTKKCKTSTKEGYHPSGHIQTQVNPIGPTDPTFPKTQVYTYNSTVHYTDKKETPDSVKGTVTITTEDNKNFRGHIMWNFTDGSGAGRRATHVNDMVGYRMPNGNIRFSHGGSYHGAHKTGGNAIVEIDFKGGDHPGMIFNGTDQCFGATLQPKANHE